MDTEMVMNLIITCWTHRNEFWTWCDDHGYCPMYMGTNEFNDIWHISDDDVYLLALLKWGKYSEK